MEDFFRRFMASIVVASLLFVPVTALASQGFVDASALNVRAKPTTQSKILNCLKRGTKVNIVEKQGDWYKIKAGNKTGYVASRYISKETTGSRSAINRNISGELINIAKNQIGKPYRSRTAGPKSFDCSGFTYYVFNKMGIKLNRSSSAQTSNGTYIPKSKLRPGDLVFFKTNGTGNISHVGLYIGNGQMIHASSSKGITKDSINSKYYKKRYATARRVL